MIATPPNPNALQWEPPGPGSWMLLADHYQRPITAAMTPIPDVWSEVFTNFLQDLGVPMKTARMALVNGLPYACFDTGGGSKPPPDWVMRIAVRLMPSMRRAEKQLARTFAERPWVEGVRRWYEHDRALATERMTALTRFDTEAATDTELAAHLKHCQREMLSSAREHLAMHAHDLFPPALFVVRMIDWGFTADEAFALLAGTSPASTGMSDELKALKATVAGRPASSLHELRALGPEVSDALDAFLERHGWRLVDGYDVDSPCLVEVPSLVLSLANAPEPEDRAAERAEAVADARARVPEAGREEFDRLLDEAGSAYGLRDDNSGTLIAWPTGLLRRAMLAAGRRLAGHGQLSDPALAIEATPAELAAALTGERPIDSSELAERAAYRRSLRAADAPRTLGPPEAPPPENLPGALGLTMRMFAILGTGEQQSDRALHGMGIGTRPYEGRARLVLGAGHGIDAFEPGDVLVAPMTSPSFNVVFAIAGAVVTEEGDAMSHAAIMARELDLPAIVGAPGVTTEIRDGDIVCVDPLAGAVRILNPAATTAASNRRGND